MVISNCFFLLTFENPRGYSDCCVHSELVRNHATAHTQGRYRKCNEHRSGQSLPCLPLPIPI